MSTRTAAGRARSVRREALLALVDRAGRSVLTRAEADRLRCLVEAEFAESDTDRRRARGHQNAVYRTLRRLDAAEQAIRETESDRDHLAEVVEKLRAEHTAAGPWPHPLHEGNSR